MFEVPATTARVEDPSRARAVGVGIVLALLSASWYGFRALGTLYALDALGVSEAALFRHLWVGSGCSTAGIVVAMLVGAALGPLRTGAAGLSVAAAGVALCQVAPGWHAFSVAWLLAAFGIGMARPACVAALVQGLGPRDGARAIATLVGADVAVTMGSFLGPIVGGGLHGAHVPPLGACGAGLGVGALLALQLHRAAAPEEGASDRRVPRAAAVSAVVGASALAGWTLGHGLASTALDPTTVAPWASLADPVVGTLADVILLGVALRATRRTRRMSPPRTAGVGLALLAAGLLAAAGLGPGDGAVTSMGALGGVGTVLAYAGLRAGAAFGVHSRAVTATVGVVSLGPAGAGLLLDGGWVGAGFDAPARAIAALAVGVAVAGVGLLAGARAAEPA